MFCTGTEKANLSVELGRLAFFVDNFVGILFPCKGVNRNVCVSIGFYDISFIIGNDAVIVIIEKRLFMSCNVSGCYGIAFNIAFFI